METFSPIAKITTVRISLTIIIHHKWNITQLDVSNAFLYGTLLETIFMCQPPKFIHFDNPTHVCHLN